MVSVLGPMIISAEANILVVADKGAGDCVALYYPDGQPPVIDRVDLPEPFTHESLVALLIQHGWQRVTDPDEKFRIFAGAFHYLSTRIMEQQETLARLIAPPRGRMN